MFKYKIGILYLKTVHVVTGSWLNFITYNKKCRYCSCQASSGVLCLVLVPTVQQRHGKTGEGSKEGYKHGQRAEEPALQGKTEGVTSFLPGESSGATHQSIPVHKGLQSCKEDRGCLFTKNHREKRRDNGYKLHQEIIIFYSENN